MAETSGPLIRLEVRAGSAYVVGPAGFLVGSVPGCDLRLPGSNLPPVLCLIAHQEGGAVLRKLAPVHPVLVNGRAVSSAPLAHGDRIGLGGAEVVVAIIPGPETPADAMPPEEALRQVQARARQLQELGEQLATEQKVWARRREEVEAECRRKEEEARERSLRLGQQERDLAAARTELEERERILGEARAELETRGAKTGQLHEETSQARRGLAEIREQLYQRYRERRDKLAVRKEAVRRAALRVRDRKQHGDAESVELAARQQEWAQRQTEIEARGEQVERERQLLEDQHRLFAGRQQELHRDLAERLADVQARERRVAQEQEALDKSQKQHQADLVLLHRHQATVEQKQKQLQTTALEVDRQFEQLQRDTRELEAQARQFDDWHNRLVTEEEEFATRKKEQDESAAQVAQRTAVLEGQQAMLATLRTRLERMREEVRRQEETLGTQRARQEESEADLRQRLEEAQRLRDELDSDHLLFAEERRRFDERRDTLDTAVTQLRQARESLGAEEAEARQRKEQLDATAVEQAEQAGLLITRATQLEEVHARLGADREALKEREATLANAAQALAALQEQVRRRHEELEATGKAQATEEQRLRGEAATLESRRAEAEEEHRKAAESLDALRQQLAALTGEVEIRQRDVGGREELLVAKAREVEEALRLIAEQRQVLTTDRLALDVERQKAAEAAERTRAELEAVRAELVEQGRQLPELEARAAAALERLAQAREQLRGHLAEVHDYARQSREDLEAARKQLAEEVERVRQQELDLHVARDEHRLAVAGFRQQLSEWQGRFGEMRQTLQQGETRLEQRQAEVRQQEQEVATLSVRLARQAEELQQQERQVAERRGEMDRHLSDMREWYRHKLRELSGVDLPEAGPEGQGTVGADAASERGILSLTGEVEPGDRTLGDLLQSLELVDADTLAALLLEARRQRRSLRQLLLAGNYLTLYQMALIEAGNLDGLVLGPVRVIDRLQATPHEAVYRVFDPRREGEALLRHLAESEMDDAVRPDEFRQRFAAAAAVEHPHVLRTLEVLDVAGRPAVLQEWSYGLAGPDWPALTAAPGVWARLLAQAAEALQAVHAAGLVHGHVGAASFVFTSEGMLKLCGLGEPRWLAVSPLTAEGEPQPADDLAALGQVAAVWAAPAVGRSGKPKPLPEPLRAILERLTADDPGRRYPTAAALLDDLEQARGAVPANAAAWERFVRQVREQSPATPLRQSA